jgi:glycosyltransferase involved in cell wall biosynthesis
MSKIVYRMDASGVGHVDHVVVENAQMRDWVLARGQRSVSLIPPGVDTEKFKPLGAWNSTAPIVAVGRLGEARKGWGRLFQAYAELRRLLPAAPKLIVAGKGELLSGDRLTLAGSGVSEQIEVRRDVSERELIEMLANGSVFVQASHEEGLGLAGLEAMACGLPMVATDTAGTREYLHHGVNGILIPQDSDVVSAIARGIVEVLSQTGNAMSMAARSEVEIHYSSVRSIDGFIAVYQQLLRSASDRT